METRDILYISAEVIVGVVSVIGNSIVLAAIIKTDRLHTITNVFVGNLAVADIVVGLLVAPCAGVSFLGLPPNFYGCVFINCLILMFTNVSILMLLAVAIERFIAIKEPFLYQRLLTTRRAVYVNLLVWLLGTVLGLVPMYGWHNGYHEIELCMFVDVITYPYMVYFQFFGLVLLPLFVMLCIYMYILVIVRRHMRQTAALNNLFRQGNQPRQNFNKDVRAAKMFALVIFLFGVFWLPVNIFNCVSLFCPTSCTFPYEVLLVAIVMSHANSSINPFLYAATNSRINQAIKALFGINTRSRDRSSTDQHMARPSNGVTRVRDNTIRPTTTIENTVNNRHGNQVFSIAQEQFQIGNGKIASRDMQVNQSEGEINHVNSDGVMKLASKESTHKDKGQPSQPPPITMWQVKGEEKAVVNGEVILQQDQLSTLLTKNQENTQEPASPNFPDSSTMQSPHNGHSNPAFVNDDTAQTVIDKTHNKKDNETDDNNVYVISEENGHRSDSASATAKTDSNESHVKLNNTNQDNVEHLTNGTLSNIQTVSSPHVHSRPSSCAHQPADKTMVRKHRASSSSMNSLGSISGPTSNSIEELGLLQVGHDQSKSDLQETGDKDNYSSHVSNLHTRVDELGIVTNSKTENTKL